MRNRARRAAVSGAATTEAESGQGDEFVETYDVTAGELMPEFDDPAYPELTEAPDADDLFLILRGPAAPTHPSETMRVKAQHVGGSATELVGQSLVTGSLVTPGGSVAVGDAFEGTPGVYFYTGGVQVGVVMWTPDASVDVTGMYLVGTDTNINAPGITISGVVGAIASLQGGDVNIKAGDVITDQTPTEITMRAGNLRLNAGDAHDTDAGLNGEGASILLARATAETTGVGGGVTISGGDGTTDGGFIVLSTGTGTGGTPGAFQLAIADVGAAIQAQKVAGVSAIGFLGASAAVQQSHITDADLTNVHTKFNSLLDKLEAYGLLASS